MGPKKVKKIDAEKKNEVEKLLSNDVIRFVEESSIFFEVEDLIVNEIDNNLQFLKSLKSSELTDDKEKLIIIVDKIKTIFLLCRYRSSKIHRLYTGALYETFLGEVSTNDKGKIRLADERYANEFNEKPNEFYIASHFRINGELRDHKKEFGEDLENYMAKINQKGMIEVFGIQSERLLNIRSKNEYRWKDIAEQINFFQDFVLIKLFDVRYATDDEKVLFLTKIVLEFKNLLEPINIMYTFNEANSIVEAVYSNNQKILINNNDTNNIKNNNKNDNHKRNLPIIDSQQPKLIKKSKLTVNSDDEEETTNENNDNNNNSSATTSLTNTRCSGINKNSSNFKKKDGLLFNQNNDYNNNDNNNNDNMFDNEFNNINNNTNKNTKFFNLKKSRLNDYGLNFNESDDENNDNYSNKINNNEEKKDDSDDYNFEFIHKKCTNFTKIKSNVENIENKEF
jgi:hypothetical protein